MSETDTPTATAAGAVDVGVFPVNRMGFGAMRITGPGVWGQPQDPEECRRVLRRALELGVNFIDTADSYGPHVSEELIADTLHPYPEGLVIGTKAGLTRSAPGAWESDCSPAHLREAVEGSLRRLRVDQVQVLQLHTVDRRVPYEESVGTLVELQREGKILEIGLCNVGTTQLRQAMELTPVVSVQNRYNVADRASERVLAMCEENRIPFIPWFPVGAGNLTAPDGPLARFGQKHRATPAQVALAWLLHLSGMMLPIPGTSKVGHLEENVAAAAIRLDPEDLRELDQLAPA
jgi:aryl-alcohol dehydrogenase-like predicted oxidoreductase